MGMFDDRRIKRRRTFIVAEISANHGQSFARAVTLMKKAKDAGVDAVKFQAYTPDTMTLNIKNKYFMVKHPQWGGQSLYDLYKTAYTPWRWFPDLKRIANDLGLTFIATAFDKTAVDMLENINVVAHKIASFELIDLPLIAYIAKTNKPLILSTGMASLPEIKDAITTAKKNGKGEIILLKCVSTYPARPIDINLKTIADLQKRFKIPVGFSDHSLDIGAAIAAVSFGAVIIEKHFTLSRKKNMVDSFFSLDPKGLALLVRNIRIAEQAIGEVSYEIKEEEIKHRVFRRSLFVVEDIKKGERLTSQNIRSIRPAHGISPKYIKSVIGKKANINLKRGTPLTWDCIMFGVV